MTRFAPLALFTLLAAPVFADDAACIERFKSLVVNGYGDAGPVRTHVVQEFSGTITENYFHSPGGSSGDGMMQPLKNMGDMWVLFSDNKMYTSTDAGETWTFGREMDAAADPGAYKNQVRKDLEAAAHVTCGQDPVKGIPHETVAGEYNSTALQGALTQVKYWQRQDTGFISKHETLSNGASGKFHAIQTIEPAPDLVLPSVD